MSDTRKEQDVPEELVGAGPLAVELVRAMRALERTGARIGALRGDRLERTAVHLLGRLVADGPQRTTALAHAVLADPSTVSRQVAHLVAEGLVERTADTADGRATVLRATPEGQRVAQAARARHSAAVETVVAEWPEQDRAALTRLLARFTHDLERRRPEVLALADPARPHARPEEDR